MQSNLPPDFVDHMSRFFNPPRGEVIHVDFRRQLQHVPYTHAERTEANRLEIVELETTLSLLNKQYEHAVIVWDVFGAFTLQQNGTHIKQALQDAYFERDFLLDHGGVA